MAAIPTDARATPEVTVEPLTGAIGAVLHGVDLRLPLADSTTAATEPATTTDGTPTSRSLRSPPLASILAAKEVPPLGGDTLWADLVGAYESLSPAIRQLVDPLVAVHDASRTFDRFQTDGDGDNRARVAALAPVRHPVVRVHPETRTAGCSSSRGSRHTSNACRVSRVTPCCASSTSTSTTPEHVVRWRWRAGDVAFWDNRATSHYAAADYGGPRIMHRITVAGDRRSGSAILDRGAKTRRTCRTSPWRRVRPRACRRGRRRSPTGCHTGWSPAVSTLKP